MHTVEALIPEGIKSRIDSALADVTVDRHRKKIGQINAMGPIRYEVERMDCAITYVGSRKYYSSRQRWKVGRGKVLLRYKAYRQYDDGRIVEWVFS